MRHLRTIAAALCCTVFLAACESNESDLPDTERVRADLQAEIDKLIGAPGLVALDDLAIGENIAPGVAEWTGSVIVQGPLFAEANQEQFGRDWLITYAPATAQGTEIEVQGSVSYLLVDGEWVQKVRHEVDLLNGKDLITIGVAETSIKHAESFRAGSPEAEARRQELQKAAQVEADQDAAATSKAQEYRAKREAEKQKMIEDRKKRKAEEAEAARKAKEAEEASQP